MSTISDLYLKWFFEKIVPKLTWSGIRRAAPLNTLTIPYNCINAFIPLMLVVILKNGNTLGFF